MRKSQFASILTHEQLRSLLQKIKFSNPVFVSTDDAPAILSKFHKDSISCTSVDEDETFSIFFKDENRFYLMMYTDFYFRIYHIVTFKDLTQEVTVIPHDPQMYKLIWDHFLYTLFQKEYEVFWWSERYISRDKLEATLKARLRKFDNESDKAIARIKKGEY